MVVDDHLVITLIRHGRTKENDEKKYIGWTDCALSEAGKEALENKRISFSPDVVLTSDLKRCIETAAIYFPKVQPIVCAAFREIHFGDWEGKTYDELKADERYNRWLQAPFDEQIPNGESYQAFSRRVWEGFKEIEDQPARHVAMITHGGVIRELLHHLSPSEKSYWHYSLKPGEWIHLKTNEKRLRRGERCISFLAEPLMESENG